MLTLNEQGLKDKKAWLDKGYTLPAFDREAMKRATRETPEWVHFGTGNIFRAFQCAAAQRLLEQGAMRTGIIAVEGFDYEIIEKGYRPCDDYSLLVTLKSDGQVDKTVIGSIAESLILNSDNDAEFGRLKDIFRSPALKLATFTITEKGYSVRDSSGELLPAVAKDIADGPERPHSYIGKVASLLYARYIAGRLPMAMVSTDNCSHNGEKLSAAIRVFAEGWADQGFIDYVKDESLVSFPWSMIDKITPRPDPTVEKMLRADGLSGLDPVITSKKTYIAPFVNAEESEYLVIEDAFPNGRPPLEKAGFIMTDRDTVNRVERMKVTTCLNPLHTALAVYGCLLGYTRISDEMKDEDLTTLVRMIGYREGLPVVTDPGVLDPKEFIDTVVGIRLPNPFMPDTPQRIACDTSQKIPIRFGETIKSYMADPDKDASSLTAIPLAIAGWLRYLVGVDDNDEPMELSPDPMLTTLREILDGVVMGETQAASDAFIRLIRTCPECFGADLKAAGLSDKVVSYAVEMLEGTGAVRRTLHRVLSQM